MKKVIAILMTMVMVVLMSACGDKGTSGGGGAGGDNKPANNDIQLTLDNYETYLQVSGTYKAGGNTYMASDNTVKYFEGIDTEITITPASSAFLYNDVTVTVMFSGTYFSRGEPFGTQNFSAEDTVKCNIGGNGSSKKSHEIKGYMSQSVSGLFSPEMEIGMAVVAVTGSVSRA